MGLLPDTQKLGLRMHRECRKRFPRHRGLAARAWRAVMYAGIANKRFPFKSVAGKKFPAFPAHVQHTILRIW